MNVEVVSCWEGRAALQGSVCVCVCVCGRGLDAVCGRGLDGVWEGSWLGSACVWEVSSVGRIAVTFPPVDDYQQ